MNRPGGPGPPVHGGPSDGAAARKRRHAMDDAGELGVARHGEARQARRHVTRTKASAMRAFAAAESDRRRRAMLWRGARAAA